MHDRFWSKVNKHGPRAGRLGRCWVWIGGHMRGGYGRFKVDGQMQQAHRVAWGDVPEGMQVLHRCDNPPCVRRSHLFLGTNSDNVADMLAKGRQANQQKTRCPAQHPYDAANTYYYRGARFCRACDREKKHAQRRAA